MNFLCRKIPCYSCKSSILKGSEAYFPHLRAFFFFFSKECNVEKGREEKSNFTAESPDKHSLKNKDEG